MKTMIRFAVLVLLLWLVTHAAFALSVSITTTTIGTDNEPMIIGETNLPDGTRLDVRLRDEREPLTLDARMYGDDVAVSDGQFFAGPFSNNLKALDPGTYIVTVSLSPFQGDPVNAVLGEDGSKLEGPLVTKARRHRGLMIEYQTTIEIDAAALSERGLRKPCQ